MGGLRGSVSLILAQTVLTLQAGGWVDLVVVEGIILFADAAGWRMSVVVEGILSEAEHGGFR